jgi:hypothetical protein
VEKHHSPYICKENTDLSMKASWRMRAAGKVQQSAGIGNSGWQYVLPDGLNGTEIQYLCRYKYQVFIGRGWLNGAGRGGGGSAGFCLDGKPLTTKGREHGELMRWASVVQNVVQPKHEKRSYVLVYSTKCYHVDLKMSTQQCGRLFLWHDSKCLPSQMWGTPERATYGTRYEPLSSKEQLYCDVS